jgi:PQQ-like domain
MLRVAAWLAVFAVSGAPACAAGWTRGDLRPVTQPAPVGGLFVLFVVGDQQLSVVGLDAATGATVWSAAASTSDAAGGVAPALEVAGANVIFLAARSTDTAALTAVDGQTGTTVWQTQVGTFNDQPAACADDPSAVCVTGALGAGTPAPLRFDAATGRRRHAPHIAGPGPREIGPGLFDAGARQPERLAAIRGGKVAWDRALSRIFPLAGATSDYGWNFGRLDRLGLFVGSVGFTPAKRHGRDVIDLGRYKVAGFRIADGVVRWRTAGFYECYILPCAGQSQGGYTTSQAGGGAETVGVRLVERGSLSFSPAHPTARPVVSAGANAVIEGFAPASGRALWRFDAGRNTGLIDLQLIPAQTGAHTVILADGGARLVSLDLADGERRAVSSTARGWCRKAIVYRQKQGYAVEAGTAQTYVGQYALAWCSARSQRRLAPPPAVPGFVGDIGARNAGLIAWSDIASVIAEPPA